MPLKFQATHAYAGGFRLDAEFTATERVTALVGPSGSGKTSILYVIAGLLCPQSGSVQLGQTTWLNTTRGFNVRPEHRGVGLVFQDHVLFPHLTVKRNLFYGHRRRSSKQAAAPIQPERVIEILELERLLERLPRNLSGGEKQRVALGRALLSSPRLLLMDEPLAALDEQLKDRVLDYLERVLDEWRLPTLYVTHSANEVRRIAEQVVVVEDGRVIRLGAPKGPNANSALPRESGR